MNSLQLNNYKVMFLLMRTLFNSLDNYVSDLSRMLLIPSMAQLSDSDKEDMQFYFKLCFVATKMADISFSFIRKGFHPERRS